MKKIKKYLILSLSGVLTTLPLVAAACNNEQQKQEQKQKQESADKTQIQKDLSDVSLDNLLALNFDEVFSVKFGVGANQNMADIDALSLRDNSNALVHLKFKNNLDKSFNFNLLAVNTEPNANTTGLARFSIQISKKDNTETKVKSYDLSGFKTTPFGADSTGTIPFDSRVNSVTNTYIDSNQLERYNLDNEEYLKELKQQYFNATENEVRSSLNYTKEGARKFNDLAQQAKIPTYEDGVYKGFTLPVITPEGNLGGLSIHSGSVPTKYSKTDFLGDRDIFKSIGLARLLPNEKYRDIAYQTVSASFSYAEDYASEIAELKEKIKKMTEWRDSNQTVRLAEYIQALVDIEKQNIEILEFDLQAELQHPTTADRDKEGIKNRYQKQKDEINAKIENEIKKLTFDQVIKGWQDEIENYKKEIATGRKSRSSSGTMWILDYEKTDNQTYPTKWYFGTNSHVARIFQRQGFNGFALTILKSNPEVGLNTKLKITGLDPHFDTFFFNGDKVKNAVTRIYDATDYLTTSPSEYLDEKGKVEYAGVEEMIDFAVVEVDFAKLVTNENDKFGLSNNNNDLTEEFKKDLGTQTLAQKLARAMTNNYADLDESKKVKFLANSYLKDYNKIDFDLVIKKDQKPKQTDQLFALGYPKGTEDFFLDKYTDDDQYRVRSAYESLWINSDYQFYYNATGQEGSQQSTPQEKLDRGNYLSYQIGYRSFIDKPGLNDGFIVSPIRGNSIYTTLDDQYESKKYFNSGLQYMLRHFVPIGGSSGSSVRNQDNRLVGVHSTIIKDARTDFVAAFRSEGWDYKGAYGQYNLEQYDLIYGGGKNQKTSYRQALEKKYKDQSGFKTQLFPNGVSKDDVPEEFKFKTQELLNSKTSE
ncbi:hypothetical protein EG856_01550 [Mycoplasmopsis phocirhinis]|uniref:DUF31 domain-containing protein n=1 Tax=Mycoplasmopsis phocirhinis TaxID=142650 RepID=A0A4P6MLV9_9BACT|nr:variable surface lipoprotein [Mycoplasmopsis phocirhinis]QBF34605.1 hypothetical protein EG856_01550 [Mycoplasmopsis phocirhinis]